MVVLEALGAAFAYAMASVLQQYTAAQAPASDALRVSLLVGLAARPLWLLGILCDVAGYGLQFLALGHGSLVLVQTLLVSGLLFALPVGALFSHSRWLSWTEWCGAAMVVAGLALFLGVASPAPGLSTASVLTWTIVSGCTVIPAVLLIAASQRTAGALRASLVALSAGIIYGLSAAYTKTVSHLVSTTHGGLGHVLATVLTTWETYAVVATGVVTLLLVQSAFQAGPLGWSLPALTVMDPIVSILIGAFAFQETIASAPEDIAWEVIGVVLMVAGITWLARSPFVTPRAATPSGSRAG